MKVRILEIIGTDYNDYDYTNTIYSLDNITDWEDVTEEEYEALALWVEDENSKGYYGRKTFLISEKMLNYKLTIASYLEKAKEKKEKLLQQEAKKKEAAIKRANKQAKDKEARAIRDREKKLAKLKKLQEELGV